MSEVVTQAVAALNEKFVIKDEGALIIDSDGARASDDDADVTLTASRETFEGILSGLAGVLS